MRIQRRFPSARDRRTPSRVAPRVPFRRNRPRFFSVVPGRGGAAAGGSGGMSDRTLTCRDCGQAFTFTAGEQAFYQERGFSEPQRCPSCRAARKAQRAAGGYGGSGYGGGPSYGGGSYGGGPSSTGGGGHGGGPPSWGPGGGGGGRPPPD